MSAQITIHGGSRANFISNPSDGALGCRVLGPRPPRGVHVFEDFIYRKRKEATISRGDRGERSDWAWAPWEDFSPVYGPTRGLSHRRTRHPGLPGGAPFRAGQGSWDRAGHPCLEGLRATRRVSGQSTALRCDPGQELGKGSSSGPRTAIPWVSLTLLCQILGVSGGRQQWSSGPSCPSRAPGQGAGGQ